MRAVLILLEQEIRDGLRNRWVVGTILILTGLALALHLLGAAPTGTVKASAMSVTVVNLSGLTVYLLPLIALMLSFDALVGEFERGTMPLLLTYPVERWQVITGKFTGQLVILSLAILIGYGGTGAAIAFTEDSGWRDADAYLGMMVSSLLLGAIFVGLGFLISIVSRERATAAALAIVLWLAFVVVYDLALLGVVVAGVAPSEELFATLLAINPTDAYRMLNLTGSGAVSQIAGLAGLNGGAVPDRNMLLTVMFVWVTVPVVATAWLLQRREL